MRRRIALLLAAMLTMGVMTAAPAVASHEYEEVGTYLALGDSVAAGTQQPLGFTEGYTGRLFEKLDKKKKYGIDNFVNMACPADDTAEMLDANTTGNTPIGSLCYGAATFVDPFGNDYRLAPAEAGSQLDAAVAYILANPGEVKLITITIGANDILACDTETGFDPTCVPGALASTATNLGTILGTLRAVTDAPIVGMNYYQPNLAFWILDPSTVTDALGLTDIGNSVLEDVYNGANAAFGDVYVADVESAFKTFKTNGKTPRNVKEICKLTLMCEKQSGDLVLSDYDPFTPGDQTDIHPSDKGYKKIAKTFEKLIKEQKLLKK